VKAGHPNYKEQIFQTIHGCLLRNIMCKITQRTNNQREAGGFAASMMHYGRK
jgi:hypothetical protein